MLSAKRLHHHRKMSLVGFGCVIFVLSGILYNVRQGPFFISLASIEGGLESRQVFNCVGGSVYAVAHPDDDLLFQSPTLLREIQSNLCITTVFLTSGDSGNGLSYAESREEGNVAAYAQMLGVNNSYADMYATFGGQPVLVRTMTAAPHIQKVFFRLPDGQRDGSGVAVTGYQSLRRLYSEQIDSIDSIDGNATFTLSDIRTAIAQILASRAPENVRTLDYLSDYDSGDHADHLAAARITAELVGTASLSGYIGYPGQNLATTLSTTSVEYKNKTAAFFTYTPYDFVECQSISACVGWGEYHWLEREYIVTEELVTSLSDGA